MKEIEVFNVFIGLYKIKISNNPLYVIPDEAFMGLGRSLWELDLSYNHLTVVPTRAMKYLQKLKMLDLTGESSVSSQRYDFHIC